MENGSICQRDHRLCLRHAWTERWSPKMYPELKTLEWELINSEITSLNSCGEQAIFKLDINYSTGYLDISF